MTLSDKAVLVLSSYEGSNVPMVIGYGGKFCSIPKFLSKILSGEIDDDINFTYEDAEAYGSCAAIVNNEMYVFGGANQKRQVKFFVCDMSRTYQFLTF